MPCAFCVLQKDHPEKIIREGEYVFAILSDPHLMKGHALVIPKRHVEKLSELSKDERDELMDEVVKIEEKLLTKAPGADISQHYRPFLPESPLKVNHLHMHIRPRELNDEFYEKVQVAEKDIFVPLTDEERLEYGELLKDI
jgi:histidine triad (HIT) family protein